MNTRLVVSILFATLAWAGAPEMPQFRWENFTTENGLPDNHVFQVKVDGNRVWAATENGLALYQNGRWKVYGTADGLAHRAVLCVDVDPRTDDVWAATAAGGGRLDIKTGQWRHFNERNTPMYEILTGGVTAGGEKVYYAV